MKGNHRLINLLSFVSMLGVLAITAAHGHVVCQYDLSDEILEFTGACQTPAWPIFTPNLDTRPSLLSLFKIFCFLRTNFLTASLRC